MGGNQATRNVILTVVSPVYGCRDCLELLVGQVEEAAIAVTDDFEVILVDDGSPDGAWQEIVRLAATRPWLRALRLSRNFGQHSAISAGLRESRGQWTVVLDCDLQDPPAVIPDLHRKAIETESDVVFAQRINRQDHAVKRFVSWAFFSVLSWLTGVKQDESTANFGIFNRPVIEAVVGMPERDRAFPLMVKWAGFRTEVLPVQHAARQAGSTSYTFGRMLRLATHIVLGYSDKPLRMVAVGGMLCSVLAFLMAALAVYKFLEGDIQVAGYTSLMASIWLLGGLTLFGLGVVGLYVGQVFVNVQGRPDSIVAEMLNHPDRSTPSEGEPLTGPIAPA